MLDDRAEIRVAGHIPATAFVALPDAASAMNEDFVETALIRLVFILVAQMPFAEDARGIPGLFQYISDSHRGQAHTLALVNGVCFAVLELMFAGHQCAPRWGTIKVRSCSPRSFTTAMNRPIWRSIFSIMAA